MGNLILLRHAATEMAGTFCGHSDPPLSSEGRAQLPALAALSRDWNLRHVYASDLQRAQETAEAIAAATRVSVTTLPGLRELSFGEWEGLTWSEIEVREPSVAATWLKKFPHMPAPGGESYEHFSQRITEAMQTVEAELSTGSVAVVSHAGVLREILAKKSGIATDVAWKWTRAYGAWIVMHPGGEILATSTENAARLDG